MAGVPTDWQLGCVEVKQSLQYLLKSGQCSDCTFLVGAEPDQVVIAGHKLVLAMASPVFEAMFYGGMAERNDTTIPIPILDVQPEAFRALLEYIYTDNVNISSFDIACQLYYAAKKYMLPHLVKKCSPYLWSHRDPTLVCRSYELARLFEENVHMDKSIQIISLYTKEVLTDSSFEDVELNTVITVFSLDHLNVDSELDLFEAVVRYAKAQDKRTSERSVTPLSENGPPNETRSKSPGSSTSKDKVMNVGGSAQNSPEAVMATQKASDGSDQPLPSGEGNNKPDPKSDKLTIRCAIEKIRFLTLTPQQFAEGPARSSLLTKSEIFALLMNIASSSSDVAMPSGFSTCRVPRKQLIEDGPSIYIRSKLAVTEAQTEGRGGAKMGMRPASPDYEALSKLFTSLVYKKKLDSPAGRSDPAAACSEPVAAHSDLAVARSDSVAAARLDPTLACSDPAAAHSGPVAARSDSAVAYSDPAVACSDSAVARSDSAAARSDPDILKIRSKLAVTEAQTEGRGGTKMGMRPASPDYEALSKLFTSLMYKKKLDSPAGRSDPAAACSDPVAACSDPVAANSDPAVARSDLAVAAHLDPTVACSDPAAARSDSTAACSDPAAARSDPVAAHSDPAVARSDPAAARSDPVAVHSDPVVARSDTAAARSDPDILKIWSKLAVTEAQTEGRGGAKMGMRPANPDREGLLPKLFTSLLCKHKFYWPAERSDLVAALSDPAVAHWVPARSNLAVAHWVPARSNPDPLAAAWKVVMEQKRLTREKARPFLRARRLGPRPA